MKKSKRLMFKKILILILIIFFSAAVGLSFFILQEVKAPSSANYTAVNFEAKSGEHATVIAKNLEKNGLISSWWVFAVYAAVKGNNAKMKAGEYQFSPSQNMKEILNILVSGKVSEYQITIPEGWSNNQIAELLAKQKIVKAADFMAQAKDLEGYLFPDTYKLKPDSTSSEIIIKMKENFENKTKGLYLTKDSLILASIIEREAKHDEDRPKIAAVFQNRLAKNMKLEADPTVQYAKGSWDKITAADLKINSPYNTYENPGLPPTPICNPGLKSIQAALNPANVPYLYFFNLKDGSAIYSQTKEEHNLRLKEHQDDINN